MVLDRRVEPAPHERWMDFGASFEAAFHLFRGFNLVVWAEKQAKHGPHAARKATLILCGTGSQGRRDDLDRVDGLDSRQRLDLVATAGPGGGHHGIPRQPADGLDERFGHRV